MSSVELYDKLLKTYYDRTNPPQHFKCLQNLANFLKGKLNSTFKLFLIDRLLKKMKLTYVIFGETRAFRLLDFVWATCHKVISFPNLNKTSIDGLLFPIANLTNVIIPN